MRLSRDDENYGDSVSIETQHTTLHQYVAEHPEIKNKLKVDPETSWIIEKIFDLSLHGTGAAKIAAFLTDEKVPCPAWIQYTRYGVKGRYFEGQPEGKRYFWSNSQVKNILKDETYIGNTVHYRMGTISYKNKKTVKKPQEEWLRVEGTHEAIISKDVFDTVQEQRKRKCRECKDKTTQIFAGLPVCPDCGWKMRYSCTARPNGLYRQFNCGKYREYRNENRRCTPHYIRYEMLYNYVLTRIQYWAAQAGQDEGKLLERLLSSGSKERNAARKKRKAEVDGLFARLYEDWAAGRITEYNFNMLTAKYQTEQGELAEKIEALTAEVEAVRQTESDAEKWLALIRQYAHPTELTAELLNALIDKILVHEATEDADGCKEQEIEIYYRFIGKID